MGTPNDYEGRVDYALWGEVAGSPNPLAVDLEDPPFTWTTRMIGAPVEGSDPGDQSMLALHRGLKVVPLAQPESRLRDIQGDVQSLRLCLTKIQNQGPSSTGVDTGVSKGEATTPSWTPPAPETVPYQLKDLAGVFEAWSLTLGLFEAPV